MSSKTEVDDVDKYPSRAFGIWSIRADDVALLKAQYRAFSRQMPMMYFILIANTWALALTHLATAPAWLALGVPVLFSAIAANRGYYWFRVRNLDPIAEAALAVIRRMNLLAILITLAFTFWALSLYPYGNAFAKAHVAFYLAITGISCIFCLMYIPSAALLVTAVVNAAFVFFFASTYQPTFVAITLNVILVSVGMLAIVLTNYRNFGRMVEANAQTKLLGDENHRLANLDSLTELPNRRIFFPDLERAVTAARSSGTHVVVGVLDLDGFKPVNDTYGHAVGDMLLRQIGQRLTAMVTPGTGVYRLGGDEFALLFQTDDIGQVQEEAYDVCVALQSPFDLKTCTARISGTIGLASFPDMALTASALFERADYAMYRAKREGGRGEPWLFTEKDEAHIKRASQIEQSLKSADLENELSLMFQPIVDAQGGGVVGFEALARWESPVLGAVSPAEFIPIAERAGTVSALTVVLFGKALKAAESWPDHIRLSFNLSVFDISSSEALLRIIAMIGKSEVAPRRIDFEITETAMVNDFAAIMAAVAMLKQIGVGISLDDFGTGYSSLRQVHQLPLDKLKIDRSFIANIDSNLASQKIVKSLVSLCNDLQLTCVVEGVETAAELEAIRGLGCTFVQGYHYGRPTDPADLEKFFSPQADRAAG